MFQCHPFKKLYSRSSLTCGYFIIAFQKGGIGLIELLDHSNIVAMVGGGKKPLFSPNTVPFLVYSHFKVMLWDDAKARFVGEVNVNMKVLSICIDTKRFCVLSLSHIQPCRRNNSKDICLRSQYPHKTTGILYLRERIWSCSDQQKGDGHSRQRSGRSPHSGLFFVLYLPSLEQQLGFASLRSSR